MIDNPLVYLNGEFTLMSEAKISVLDRGFIFGDGIYEVIPVYDRKMFRAEQHLARLFRSLDAVRIKNVRCQAFFDDEHDAKNLYKAIV